MSATLRGLTRHEQLALAVHRALDKWLSPLGVWLMRRTGGSLAARWNVKALVLTTRGRRTGRRRAVVLQYFQDGESMIVVAANDGGSTHPGWYYNLVDSAKAFVEVDGQRVPVHAEELAHSEAALWWSRIIEAAPSYERYRRATSRPFPILRLIRTAATPTAPNSV